MTSRSLVGLAAVASALGLGACSSSGLRGQTTVPTTTTSSTAESGSPVTVPATADEPMSQPTVVPSCTVDGQVLDIAVTGRDVYFVGEFSHVVDATGESFERAGVAGCTLDGAVLEFSPGPIDGLVRVLDVTQGRVLLGGTFTLPEVDGRRNFAAVDLADGGFDETWGPSQVNGGVHEISIAPSGSVYIGGALKSVDGAERSGVARLTPDGTLDTEFAPQIGPVADGVMFVTAIAEADGDRVYIGGDFGSLADTEVVGVGAVDTLTGRVALPFSPDLTDTNPSDDRVQIRSIVPDGESVYLCGDWWVTEGRGDKEHQRNIGRFDARGIADPTFEPWTDGGVRDCALGAGGLVVGGHFDTVNDERSRKIAVISLSDGSARHLVDADSAKGVQSLVVHDDTIVLGGSFQNVNGQPQVGLAVIVNRADR